MLLIRDVFCHVAVYHSVLCQHVLCLQASLPIPSDRSFPMTSLLAAGDLKPTRAYEGHVPRLSLLSWCASSSPAQDWIACAATRSLPGNERTLWLSPSLPTHPPINQLLVCPLVSLPTLVQFVQLCLSLCCRLLDLCTFLFIPESNQHSN